MLSSISGDGKTGPDFFAVVVDPCAMNCLMLSTERRFASRLFVCS